MTEKQLQTLHDLLTIAQIECEQRISSKMPGDKIPDRVAIPWLTRLEIEQTNMEEAFRRVFDLIAS